MKIGVSSAVLYPLESELAIEMLLDMGFSELEFFFNCEYERSEPFVEKIKKELKSHDARVVSVHPFTAFAEGVFLFSEYKRRTAEGIERYAGYFKTAGSFGAKFFTFHGDRAFGGLGDDACKLSECGCDVLSRLCNIAKENGVTLCLENVSWCKSANLSYLSEVARKVPDIGFTLDLKQARRAGVPVEEYLGVMGDKIRNIHVSDFDDEHDCLLPGEGKFDFASFFECIKRLGYSGDIIMEVYSSNFENEKQILRAKRYLEDIVRS